MRRHVFKAAILSMCVATAKQFAISDEYNNLAEPGTGNTGFVAPRAKWKVAIAAFGIRPTDGSYTGISVPSAPRS